MNPIIKQYKVVNQLPSVLDTDAIYYVKTSIGFDMYITDHTAAVARPLNAQLSDENYISLNNEEAFGIPKGSPVFNTGTGMNLASASSPLCKKLVGLVVFDVQPGSLGLIQTQGVMTFNTTEWSIVTGTMGGIANSSYWLDRTPGKLISTPLNESAQATWSLKVGSALNNSSFSIEIQPTIKL